jgi:anti-sigma regulatory factor (Ser/Thr protein kinase)
MSQRIDLSLRPGPRAPGEARKALDRLTGELLPSLVEDVRLLVSELVTNSYRHAAAGPDGSIDLRIEARASRVRVEVCDAGTGFDPRSLPAAGRASGWGLYLVRNIADRWGVSAGNACCVWFEIDVPAESGLRATEPAPR